jgi:hypothetical protein
MLTVENQTVHSEAQTSQENDSLGYLASFVNKELHMNILSQLVSGYSIKTPNLLKIKALFVIFASAATPSFASDPNCNVTTAVKTETLTSSFFVDVLGQKTEETGSLTLGCSGNFGLFDYDLAVRKKTNEDLELRVRTFKFSSDIGDNAHVIFGYHPQNTDSSYTIQPIGLFGDSNDYARFTDRFYERESALMSRLEFYFDTWTISSTITENRRHELNSLQWINTAAFSFGSTDTQVVARYDEKLGVGAGASFTTVVGNNLELHGSFFAQQGSAKLYHADAISGTKQFRAQGDSPIERLRLNSSTLVPRLVLGGHYTFENSDNLLFEVIHDGEGMTSQEWKNYASILDFHQNTPVPAAAKNGNLGFDLQALGNANMQNYAFFRYSITRTAIDWSFSTLINLDDGSARSGIDAVYNLADGLDLYGEVSVASGCRTCELNYKF